MRKKLLALFMLLPMLVFAEVVEIEGVYYDLLSSGDIHVANVVSGETKPKGDIIIPPTIVVNDVEFTVKRVSDNAFLNCDELISISLPNTIITIGQSSFSGCVNLCSIYIPNSLQSIDDNAFADCQSLEVVKISDLSSWLKIEFGNSMGTAAANPASRASKFYLNDEELNDIVIPDDITVIKNNVFNGGRYIKSIRFHDNVSSIGNMSFTNTEIEELEIPKNCTYLGLGSFCFNKKLKKLIITSNPQTTYISGCSFQNCEQLTEVHFYGNADIKYDVFLNCKNLSDVFCYTGIPDRWNGKYNGVSADKNAFDSKIETAVLHVPEEHLEVFKNTLPWSRFGIITSSYETNIDVLENDDVKNCFIYDLSGNKIPKYKKGINILRMNNGKTKKVIGK